jgi:hypothetical protein
MRGDDAKWWELQFVMDSVQNLILTSKEGPKNNFVKSELLCDLTVR